MFTVTEPGGVKCIYSGDKLLELLFQQVAKGTTQPIEPAHQALVQALIDFFRREGITAKREHAEAMMAGFLVGFNYRLFLEKHHVMYSQSSSPVEAEGFTPSS